MSDHAWAWVGLGCYWAVVIAMFFAYAYSRPPKACGNDYYMPSS